MRILHLATFLKGGAGRAVAELARAQRAAGHSVVVTTSRTPSEGGGNYAGHLGVLRAAGVPVHQVDALVTHDHALNLNALRFVQLELGGARSFDIIHAHAAGPSLIALLMTGSVTPRVPVLRTMHGWGTHKTAEQQQSDLTILSLLPRVIVPSAASRRRLADQGVDARCLRVIPYGVSPSPDPLDGVDSTDPDLQDMRNARRAGQPVICCIGIVDGRRNQRLLVQALSLLPPAERPLCVCVGEGDVAELTMVADRLGVGGSIRFCGHKANARQFLREATCLVRPSLSEDLPLTILEAFCDHVPVLTSDLPELAEIVRQRDTGFVFRRHDPRGLAEAIREVVTAPSGDLAAVCRRAHNLYRSHFTTRAMAGQYMAEYEALLADPAQEAGSWCAA